MIKVSSRNFSLTDSIKEEVNIIGESIFKHMSSKEGVNITLSKESPTVFKVNIQSHYRGEDIVCHHESHNFHKALELCKDHFIKLVDKRKSIENTKRR